MSVGSGELTRGPWATMLIWVNSYKSLIQHFRLSLAMATKQNEEFVQILYAWWRTYYSTNIYKNVVSKYLQWNSKTYFHFPHYKSMEIVSCHSNESTWATATINIKFVEANVMNISAKFQLHAPYGFWGDEILIFFPEFIISVAMATNQIQQFGQNFICSEKRLSKYLQWDKKKRTTFTFPIISLWKL